MLQAQGKTIAVACKEAGKVGFVNGLSNSGLAKAFNDHNDAVKGAISSKNLLKQAGNLYADSWALLFPMSRFR